MNQFITQNQPYDKYRIAEVNNLFYPQGRKLDEWYVLYIPEIDKNGVGCISETNWKLKEQKLRENLSKVTKEECIEIIKHVKKFWSFFEDSLFFEIVDKCSDEENNIIYHDVDLSKTKEEIRSEGLKKIQTLINK